MATAEQVDSKRWSLEVNVLFIVSVSEGKRSRVSIISREETRYMEGEDELKLFKRWR